MKKRSGLVGACILSWTILMGAVGAPLWAEPCSPTPPSLWERPCLCVEEEPVRLLTGLQVLVWTACGSDFDYALTAETNGVIATEGRVEYLDPHWDVGVKAMLGYAPSQGDGWQTQLGWTHFRTVKSDSAEEDSSMVTPVLFATRAHPDLGQTASSAHGTLNIHYDCVELTNHRPYTISHSLLFQPFTGTRFVCLEQDLRVNYVGDDFAASGDFVNWKSRFCGLGFVGGSESLHKITSFCGGVLSFYGKMAASLITGRNEATQEQIGNGLTEISMSEKERCLLVCAFEAGSGVTWEAPLEGCGTCGSIEARLGFETVQYSNTPVQRRFVDEFHQGMVSTGSGGTLGFDGFFASLQVIF